MKKISEKNSLDFKNISDCIYDSFDKGKKQLESRGFEICSLKELAIMRIYLGKKAIISKFPIWSREGFLYIPKKGKFLTKKSPAIDYPEEIVQSQKNEGDFYLTESQIEKALSDSIKLPDGDFSIPAKRLGEDAISDYVFGNSAKDYGLFLNYNRIKAVSFWIADMQDKPFVRQALFSNIGWSLIIGDSRALGEGSYIWGWHKIKSE